MLGYETESLRFDQLNEHADAIGYIAFKNPIKGKRRIKHPFSLALQNEDDWWKFTNVFFEPLD